jgi:hypothetical protein
MRRRREAAVRRSAARLLDQLGLRPPLDLEEFARRLGDRRGRPIEVVPHAFPTSSTFGLWIAKTDSDLVLFEQDTTEEHQRHIVLHEFGHIVMEHASDEHDDAIWRELTPTMDPDVVRAALRRSGYENTEEHEAEVFASVISDWLTRDATSRPRSNLIEEAIDASRGWH